MLVLNANATATTDNQLFGLVIKSLNQSQIKSLYKVTADQSMFPLSNVSWLIFETKYFQSLRERKGKN